MKLFEYIDAALLQVEERSPRVSHEAKTWPSSASAENYDKSETNQSGKCHRQEVFKMIGEPQTNPNDAVSLRRFRMGRACEADVVELSKQAGIFVASGVRAYIPDIGMSFEMDLIVMDPKTGQAIIVENKSIYGFYANKEVIRNGNPKKDAVMQTLVYVNEIGTGAQLKATIKAGLEKQTASARQVARLEADLEAEKESDRPNPDEVKRLEAELETARYFLQRNRIEVNQENLDKISDGPIGAKVATESRDECETREMDLAIYEDPVTHKHVPLIDGEPYRWFDIESIYARWRLLKERFNKVRDEALRRLADRGIMPPAKNAPPEEVESYWNAAGAEMRSLPKEFLPPAEFEWRYSDAKIEMLWSKGLIGKTKYNGWKKGHKGYDRIGDWQCSFCAYKAKCLPLEYPDLAFMALDQLTLPEEAEAA